MIIIKRYIQKWNIIGMSSILEKFKCKNTLSHFSLIILNLNLGNQTIFYLFLSKYTTQYIFLSFHIPLKYYFFTKIQVSYILSPFLQNINTVLNERQ
jgi:hypothetical protein